MEAVVSNKAESESERRKANTNHLFAASIRK